MEVSPDLEYAFAILSRRWNGLIIHLLAQSKDGAHFTEIKHALGTITPRALSMKLDELIRYGIIVKERKTSSPKSITYTLTEKGLSLSKAFNPIQKWAKGYRTAEGM